MVDPATLAALDLLLRGGVVLLLGLIAAGLLREWREDATVRLGALFAIGGASYAICSAPGFHASAGLWAAPFLGIAVANNLVFWLFARSLFAEGFQLRPIYAAAWGGLAIVGVANGFHWLPDELHRAVGLMLMAQAMGFALLAAAQTLSSWPADLVEPRRRLRVILVAGSTVHVVLTVLAGLSPRLDSAPPVRLADVAAQAVLTLVVSWGLLRVSPGAVLLRNAPAREADRPAAGLDVADVALLRRLDREMSVERVYRRDDLTIGRLAHMLDVPEYRLRRIINQGLGQRNFAAYLNRQRIAEAKVALADPTQNAVPILTIALDAGFGSLGPFNRAFKAETGMTPSEYRRAFADELRQASAA
jgi:AraC-like DNA-binding protein